MTVKRASTGEKASGRYASRAAAGARRRTSEGEFSLSLPSKAVETLSSRKAKVRDVLRVLSEQMEATRKSGRPAQLLVEVDRRGEPRIALKTADAEAPPAEDDNLEAALRAARERGRLRAAEVLAGDEMLGADAFAELLGVSRVTVNAKRQRHEVLALDGARRGYRFPAWQLDQNGKPFAALPQLFERLGDSPWTVYRFLIQRHPELEGATALDALRRGRSAEVLEAADSVATGAFA
jgi:hypothetical protein